MSALVAATTAHLVLGLFNACQTIHSEPVLVLPHPRPERISQVFQFVSGGNWFDLACFDCHWTLADANCIVSGEKRGKFSEIYTKSRKGEGMANFRKEVALELEIKHFENPTV